MSSLLLLSLLTLACSDPPAATPPPRTANEATEPEEARPQEEEPVEEESPPAGASIEGWHAIAAPALRSPGNRCAGFSRRAFRVRLAGGGVLAEPAPINGRPVDPIPEGMRGPPGARGNVHVLRVEGGALVGIDAGEWGGGLYLARPGADAIELATGDNITGFLEIPGGALALRGMGHLSIDRGELLRLRPDPAQVSGWRVERLATLPSMPIAALRTEGGYEVLASAGLYRVSEDGRVTPLHRGSWIYPTSLVRRGEEIYIGMRWAIVHLRPGAEGAYEERWLLPEPCPSPSFDERSLRCECGSAR